MFGVLYVCCTSVGRSIIYSHLANHKNIPILGIVNLNREKAISKANYDSLYDIALHNKIEIYYCNNVNSKDTLKFISDKNPTLIIQSGWSQKFSKKLLNIPKYGCIGEHPSPIPKGRGAACVNWAILENQREWGDSFFQMVEEYDKGSVYAQQDFIINMNDDVKKVYDKVGLSSYITIKKYLNQWVNGHFNLVELDESKATYYKRRTPKDGEILFSWEDKKIFNFVRGLNRPYPGAYFTYRGVEIIVWEAEITDKIRYDTIGSFNINDYKQCLEVTVANNKVIRLNRLQFRELPEFDGNKIFDMIELFGDELDITNIY